MDLAQWPLNRLLNTAARLSSNRENEQLRRLGTTHAGLLTLRVLGRTNSITQVELARELRVQAQTVGKLVERLETRGLIVRTRSGDDRRVYIVSLTAEGEAMLQRAQSMEEEQARASGRSDAVLRAELIAHIRDLGGTPEPSGQRANLDTDRTSHAQDESLSRQDVISG